MTARTNALALDWLRPFSSSPASATAEWRQKQTNPPTKADAIRQLMLKAMESVGLAPKPKKGEKP